MTAPNAVAVTLFAFVAGALYVMHVHMRPVAAWPSRPWSLDWWAHRLGATRWRRVNVPVVGPPFAIAGLIVGRGPLGDVLVCIAIGMTAAALGGRLADPLPPLPQP